MNSALKFSKRYLQRLTIGLVCLGLIMVTGGCLFPFRERPAGPQAGSSPVELKNYIAAVDLYHTRDYEKSARQFESIREQTANPEMSRMALYGLTCSRLMSANTLEEYKEALNLWDSWMQYAVGHPNYENPALFAPVLKEKMIFSYVPVSSEGESDPRMPDRLLAGANQELKRVKKQLDEAGKTIDLKDKKIKALEKEISRLNEQISAFEKIDEKIQKKKNAIPSAD
ncbi:MAG: hypothetical protein C4519_25370 [Desulfobacteraceae bacterium]|nr:MAG: hypothetical protein C4519_25370 [Desulfobacteraceae bacterium]